MKKIIFIVLLFFITYEFIDAQEKGSFIDIRDNRLYKTVKIGTQTWMAENLAYKISDGCWAYNNDTNYTYTTYGLLYNWYESIKICPNGWHLPSDAEWRILTDYLGGQDIAGEKMKAMVSWDQKANETNSSGFSGIAAGRYNPPVTGELADFYSKYTGFKGIGIEGGWWSSTDDKEYEDAYFYSLYFMLGSVNSILSPVRDNKNSGNSVRCIKNK
ncbi:MAG TPA: hypothetical protein DDX39_12220 [Bacteroidales bacterium]|nr:MAG: hypothetical protein A2W98_11625 [Bacteroidetes bacterium GWF2_33_38]OFY75539.1 MAG: hypothetical protein A2265_03070 [Bacteroidetes bacterium RIFOXYA12_FULL_33_9]OFY88842.1 MAG: hypothetical protein A2236_08515 [Bacteroidetes bacterium RIFOXYA2_FULL_33_7]HBF89398.1 hypothetical protein [Bacteroidales bacterium]